jgi:putative membrane protein
MPLWLMMKLALVVVLSIFHAALARFAAEFRTDQRGRGDRFFRIINEIPTLLLIGIVVLVVVKPGF